MPRKLRFEGEGAMYHVINRGNYRQHIFREDGAKETFLICLEEACKKTGWRVHAWCIMSNHFHLALETPRGNLVEGMTWLQATFATRFNRHRGESGHLFQGRYKSLYVEGQAGMGALCHYLHLNPVRAKVLPVDEVLKWPWTSLAWMSAPKRRPEFYSPQIALKHAGNLADTMQGWRQYRKYLAWVAESEPVQRQLGFKKMSKGWAIGSDAFKKNLIAEHREKVSQKMLEDPERAEAREAFLRKELRTLLRIEKKTVADIATDRKSANWKLEIAAAMKQRTTVTNRWLSDALRMGHPSEVSRLVTAMISKRVRKRTKHTT